MAMKTYLKEISKSLPKIFNEINHSHQSMYYSRANPVSKKEDELVKQLEKKLLDLLGSDEDENESECHTLLLQKFKEESNENKEMRKKRDKEQLYESPFVQLFQSLPANFPVNEVLLNGIVVEVTRFINVSAESDIAHFSTEDNMKSFDINKIDGIHWGREDITD
ncbi:hypothetical protein N0O92_12495 [Alkalihalobacillus sp. MEB130]|uniref:hypothetical protein n=1 Tax=Alkalihalobacillus sp. MEB130 TaxID=2976704 RepID=UPI0028DF3398|nr:hypothetical protein [Alkalihalobacillus sp. MEB130]MDT8861054.1 hypothetical protein [Alkalihalobacillus sp. MEB130]